MTCKVSVSAPRILGLVPLLPSDFSSKCIESILFQDVAVNQVFLVLDRGKGGSFPARMSDALNRGLSAVDLSRYDWILRVDSDTVLPRNFLGSALSLNVDVVGYGHAHLIRVSAFMKAMGGKFNQFSDDSYLNYKFQMAGFKWSYWDVKPIMERPNGRTHQCTRYFIERGISMWQLGFEPLHVLGSVRWEMQNVFAVFGYFSGLLRGVKKLDVSGWVFRYQLGKLWRDLGRKRRW